MRTHVSRRLAVTGLLSGLLLCFGLTLEAQSGLYANARDLVGRVQSDLRRSSEVMRNNHKNIERYEHAQHHLSEFDKALADGKFDKDKLDQAIDDMKNVVENNDLQGEDRDALAADLRDLRQLRATRGALP
jgi:cell division protein FtsB